MSNNFYKKKNIRQKSPPEVHLLNTDEVQNISFLENK